MLDASTSARRLALAVALAFLFGYGLTSLPLLRSGMSVREVAPLALASDTASIGTMEVVDNLFVLLVPGAIAAGLGDALFWWSLGLGLLIAGLVAWPLNGWLISRGKGHAVVHAHHGHAHYQRGSFPRQLDGLLERRPVLEWKRGDRAGDRERSWS